ncbi:MAG: transcriptional repressor [Phycisphaeraceae bacterium]|nr:MAG: transcriptional repressor [Phycisphaeraceae bacterium]
MDADRNAATIAPDDEILVFEPLCAVFRRSLKKLGQKYTPERAQVLDAILRRDGLFEAEELQRRLKSTGFRVSKATVYRTLRLLQDAGIIRRVNLGDDQARYQLVWGREPHDLIVVIGEDRVIPVEVPELAALRDRLCREHGLTARGHSFCVYAEPERVTRPAPRDPPPPRRTRA